MLRHITRVIAASERCEDLVFVREHELGLWVVVLDGAGGMSGGLRAVELAAALLGTVPSAPTPATLVALLSEVDDALDRDRGAGETTAVVAWVSANHIAGASAGDSSLLLVSNTGEQDLTANQQRARHPHWILCCTEHPVPDSRRHRWSLSPCALWQPGECGVRSRAGLGRESSVGIAAPEERCLRGRRGFRPAGRGWSERRHLPALLADWLGEPVRDVTP